jgi:hypothetical protein
MFAQVTIFESLVEIQWFWVATCKHFYKTFLAAAYGRKISKQCTRTCMVDFINILNV